MIIITPGFLIKAFLITIVCIGVIVGISWSILDKKFNYNTFLIACCIVLIVAFNIK